MAQPYTEPCNRGLIECEPCPREKGTEVSPQRRAMVLSACVIASSMAFIDGSALTVALPRLRADLGADMAAIQWVVNGYVLALAALTLAGGALADVHGKARMLMLGCFLFGVASVACAAAPNITWLIAARIAQGIAAALLTPASLALIGATYPKSERNTAIGVWAAASALTTAGGPVLGGWLTETYGWPAIFWINPPLALAAVVLVIAFAPQDRRLARQFDVIGAAILAVALGAFAWALSQIGGGEVPLGSETVSPSRIPIVVAAITGALGLGVFAWWERISAHPMTPPRLVRNQAFFGLNGATLLIYAGLSIMFFVLSFELIDHRGLDATEAGMAFLPFTLAVGLLSKAFGGLADKMGPRPLLVFGPAAASLAYVWMALTRDASLLAGVIAPMALLGLSFAILVAPLTASVLSSVDEADEGLASGINNAASRIAQLGGVALAAGVASFSGGYEAGLVIAAVTSLGGAFVVAFTVPASVSP